MLNIIDKYLNYFKNLYNKFNFKNFNCYFIYISLVCLNLLFFLIFFKIESDKPCLRNRTLGTIKKYNNENKIGEGLGGAYVPDTTPTPLSVLNYVIQKGDSIHSITQKFGIDEMTIINYNNIADPLKIVRGATIKIPNQDGIFVKVDKKNSLKVIAEKYKIEKETLCIINNIDEERVNGTVFVPGIHFDSVTKALILGEYFRAPVYGRFTSFFGFRKDPWTKKRSFHQGLDIANYHGTKIRAAGSGRVIFAGDSWPLGVCVKIQHINGYVTYYGHLSKILVSPGSYVTTGQVIGLMGDTGRAKGSHLHFEIRRNGVAINPLRLTVF